VLEAKKESRKTWSRLHDSELEVFKSLPCKQQRQADSRCNRARGMFMRELNNLERGFDEACQSMIGLKLPDADRHRES
jgi:hypothetical protein